MSGKNHDLIGKRLLLSAEDLSEITDEAARNAWSARFSKAVLDEVVDKSDTHLVVPFLKNGSKIGEAPSFRCSLWYKVASTRRRERVVIDVSGHRLRTLTESSEGQLKTAVALLVEEIPAQFLSAGR